MEAENNAYSLNYECINHSIRRSEGRREVSEGLFTKTTGAKVAVMTQENQID